MGDFLEAKYGNPVYHDTPTGVGGVLIDDYMHLQDRNGNFRYMGYDPKTGARIGEFQKPAAWIMSNDPLTKKPRGDIFNPHTLTTRDINPDTNMLQDIRMVPIAGGYVDSAGNYIGGGRFDALAQHIIDKPEYTKKGIFTNHPLADLHNETELIKSKLGRTETILRGLGRTKPDTNVGGPVEGSLTTWTPGARKGAERVDENVAQNYVARMFPTLSPDDQAKMVDQIVTDAAAAAPHNWIGEVEGGRVADVFARQGINPEAGANRVIRERAENSLRSLPSTPAEWISRRNEVLKEYVKPEHMNDFFKWGTGVELPPAVETARKVAQSLTSVFKAGVLNWPARYVRDFISSSVRLVEERMAGVKDVTNALKLFKGQVIPGLEKEEFVQRWLKEMGHASPSTATPAEAARAVRVKFSAYSNPTHRIDTDVTGMTRPITELNELVDPLIGKEAKSALDIIRDAGASIAGKRGGSAWKFWRNRGWREGFTGDVLRTPEFGLAQAGDIAAQFGDNVPRLAGFLGLVRQGYDPAAAMRKVQRALVSYDPKQYTGFEKILKDIFPFYSFSRGSAAHLVPTLMERPGGRLGTLIQASGQLRNPDVMLPDFIANTAAIPIGVQEDGTQRYITGLGLMHEDPMAWMNLLRFAPLQVGSELISRADPMFKGALEYIANRAFFQSGPFGPRALDDADPMLARLWANVRDLATGEKTERVTPAFGSPLLEVAIANSPFSRGVAMLRAGTQKQKLEHPLALAANLGTGVRMVDVTPASMEGQQREAMGRAMKAAGASEFSRVRFSKDQQAKMTPEEQSAAADWNQYAALLAKRAKERAKAKAGAGNPYAGLIGNNPLLQAAGI